jgi:hypothetical protein
MKTWKLLLSALLVGSAFTACVDAGVDEGEDLDGDGKADGTQTGVSADNLNGLWDGKLGTANLNDAVIRSWSSVGIELQVGDKVYKLTRTSNTLKGEGVELSIVANGPGQRDDAMTGKIDGKTVKLARDIDVKDEIVAELPGDRPWRVFLHETLAPLAQQDRESYVVLDAAKIKEFMHDTVLFKAGSFQRKYMKGSTRAQQNAEFDKMIDDMDGLETTPRAAIYDPKFSSAVKAHLKDTSLTGLALTNFNLYFTTGAGRSVKLPLTDDAFAYFITDRPSRAEKLGLVVMDTPSHDPLASTFGRQLLDLGEMPAADTVTYGKAMIELLAKSSSKSVPSLSGTGKSALVDWYAVMAIEDYRGTDFGNPDLGWGYNLTNAQLYGLIVRALARPGQTDSAGKPVVGQLIVGSQLRPGDPSYVDVLNGGNDMQEYPDMAKLKTLTTKWLRSAHAAEVTEVEAAFAGIIPAAELDSSAKTDIFHFITAQFYDERIAGLKGAAADRAVTAVTKLLEAMTRDSAALETYLLTQSITKSNEAAPKATGF